MKIILKIFFLFTIFTFFSYAQTVKNVDRGKPSEIKIGVMIPINVSENYKEAMEIGQDILDAIKYATEEFNSMSKIKVILDIRDSKLDSIISAQTVKLMVSEKNLISILGPIFSDEFVSSARVANENGIPIISPTATGNNLAGIGEFVFQANPDFITRAKAMAIYANTKLQFRNFACFAPNTTYGKVMVEYFSKTTNKLGGNILAIEMYENDLSQVQKSMNSLCKKTYERGYETYISFMDENKKENIDKIIKFGIPKRRLDSIILKYSEASIYEVFGKDAQNVVRKLNIKTITKTKYEVDFPVNSIDGIYIPITSKNDIKLISAALTSYKIHSKILGTGDFFHALELEATKDKMDGLIFDYDSYSDIKEFAYKNFYKNYVQKTKKQVTKYTLYGYDIISVLLSGISKGFITKKDMKIYLDGIDKYPGLHSQISFKKNRVNSNLNILEYKNSRINKIDQINIHDN